MSISTAIAALNPNLWWKLDETSGTTAANSGSLSTTGTYSGGHQLVAGPEYGTSGHRLFAGGQVLGNAGMDITALADMTWGMWVSAQADGTINTTYPFASVGDVSNRLNRGVTFSENHTTIGNPSLRGRFNQSPSSAIAPPPYPALGWHWVVWTFQTGTAGQKVYMDGVLIASQNSGSLVNALSTDPLLLKCDESVALAHVCYWGRILSLTEIQTVSSEIAPWPHTVPVNTPPPSGGGGGLTEEQAAQLDTIEGFVSDIPGVVDAVNFISDTVNTISGVTDAINTKVDEVLGTLGSIGGGIETMINDWLTPILNGITAHFQTLSGSIAQTIGDLLSGKSVELLTLDELSPGVTCEPVEALVIGWFGGIIVRIASWPVTWEPLAPDHDFYVPDFCVVTIKRGSDHFYRYGVHQTNWALPYFPIMNRLVILGEEIDTIPPDTIVHVDWAPGVCGQIFVQRFP